jgi:hypothetical protein
VLIIEPRWILPHLSIRGPHISWYLVMLMLVLTVVSGVDYFVHARQRIQERTETTGGDAGADGTGTSKAGDKG